MGKLYNFYIEIAIICENMCEEGSESISGTKEGMNIFWKKRQPYIKTGRRPYWKTTSACLATQSSTELGPAQPQLV